MEQPPSYPWQCGSSPWRNYKYDKTTTNAAEEIRNKTLEQILWYSVAALVCVVCLLYHCKFKRTIHVTMIEIHWPVHVSINEKLVFAHTQFINWNTQKKLWEKCIAISITVLSQYIQWYVKKTVNVTYIQQLCKEYNVN